jgi:hypothetical protein
MDPEVLNWNGVDYVPKAHCDGLGNEIRELQAENDRLNMEMVAYRQKLTPKDVEAMTACIKALTAEKAARTAVER